MALDLVSKFSHVVLRHRLPLDGHWSPADSASASEDLAEGAAPDTGTAPVNADNALLDPGRHIQASGWQHLRHPRQLGPRRHQAVRCLASPRRPAWDPTLLRHARTILTILTSRRVARTGCRLLTGKLGHSRLQTRAET